ncbi:stage III sporulation protein AA [Ferdinandcohnia quinoae]|uniref:Stage III sporulation protein AA n=1 Tax=Fredinandcohnia quinoae TaxID=2918902 RepID=A0AAW5E9B2_9BACI|nr:stage III sporulation protein AA [Fredinandcohnia sp. SECRCQ15]MCH1626616.1 stage III sporulation protein AA [Fredinandcohnia sp. SECRCQ15]
MNEIIVVLSKEIAQIIRQYPPEKIENMEEIRIRVSRPLEVVINGIPSFHHYIITSEDANQLLNKLSQYSIYTLEEELKRGYITIQGGHRVGLAGKVITENGRVKAIRDVTSFNIRIAKQKIGVANQLSKYLFDQYWRNTIIIGPPQTGKTTLLRDIARMISSGIEIRNIPPLKVGIVDERSEIAGCVKGIPQATLGHRVDVLDSCPKAEGMMMMIRSMSPDVLIVDEIGRAEDSEAILEAVNAGVSLVVTVHGHELADLQKRPTLKRILDMGVIERFVELSRTNGPGTVKAILNRNGKQIIPKVSVT